MKWLFASGFLLLASPAVPAQNELDNKGDDFILAWLPARADSLVPAIELHLTSDVPTDVTVQYPVTAPAFSTTVAVVPGAITIVSLPTGLFSGPANAWANDTVSNNCVRAFAAEEFVAYTISRVTFTSDAALGLPVETMNTQYILADYDPTLGLFPSEFVVYAGFDATTVTITPAVALVGRPAGVPFDVVLNRGEGYLGRSASLFGPSGSVSGTLIESSKPVGVVNGSECVNVPSGFSACDHVYEVAQPVQTWGNEVLVANLPLRPAGSIYRILASEDNTSVLLDGALLATLDRAQYFETAALTGNHVIAADRPIYVCQFMTSQGFGGGGTGDPAMGNMIPSEQYLTDYTFSTIGGGQFAQNFLTIYAHDSDLATITLDGAPIGAGNFSSIAGSGFSVALLPLSEGTHTTASTNPHGITVEGYNSFDSYLYPGGARFALINPVGDANAPECETVGATAIQVDALARDDRPSEDVDDDGVLDPGEDLNGNGQIDKDTGIFFVTLDPASVNVSLAVDPFVPGAGQVGFHVSLVNVLNNGVGHVSISDGAGNVTRCQVNFGVQCYSLDFQTEDDFKTPLVNGQDISSPAEFGALVSISSSGPNAGAAIFNSTPGGPNDPSQDRDLLVGSGNILILQTNDNTSQTVPGIFNRPNDDEDGGTLRFDFSQPASLGSVDLIDVDSGSDEQLRVVLTDSGGKTRTYTVPPRWTGDLLADGTSGKGTLDLSTLAPQPGFLSTATASENAGFQPAGVVRMDVIMGSSGAVDNLAWCLPAGLRADGHGPRKRGAPTPPRTVDVIITR